jgi:hypothetical protein
MTDSYPFTHLLQSVEQLHDCVLADASPSEIQFGLTLTWSIHKQIQELHSHLQQQDEKQRFEDEFSLLEHVIEKVHDDLNGFSRLPRITIEVYIEYMYLQLKELLSQLNEEEPV